MNTGATIHVDTINIYHTPADLLTEQFTALPGAVIDSAANQPSAPEGTVIDHVNGLMWSKTTNAKNKTWADAKAAAAAVTLGGFGDWRLPTRAELLTLVDDTRSEPAIDTARFDCDAAWYWTATPLASAPSASAWVVNFYYGVAGFSGQNFQGRVRAVRSVSSPASGQ
jgi:hypothetical protein